MTQLDIDSAIARHERVEIHDGSPRAAVALILCGDAPEGLVIRRAEREGDRWSGQMALPGGHVDAEDEDEIATAMRETVEETGLVLEREQCVGVFSDVSTQNRPVARVITPVVFRVPKSWRQSQLTLDPNEVAEALWVDLGALHRGERDTLYELKHEGLTYKLPAFDIDGRVLWGLTRRILGLVFETGALADPA